MAITIKVKNTEEFEELIKNKDLRISKAIVSGILENLVGKKKNIYVLEIFLKDEDSIVDITVHSMKLVLELKRQLII